MDPAALAAVARLRPAHGGLRGCAGRVRGRRGRDPQRRHRTAARSRPPLVYAASAGVVFFGLRAVGIFEALGVIASSAAWSRWCWGPWACASRCPSPSRARRSMGWPCSAWSCTATTPSSRCPRWSRDWHPMGAAAARAVAAGLAVNGLLIAVVAAVALAVSEEVTEVAIVGISDRLGTVGRWHRRHLRLQRAADHLLGGLAGAGGHHQGASWGSGTARAGWSPRSPACCCSTSG